MESQEVCPGTLIIASSAMAKNAGNNLLSPHTGEWSKHGTLCIEISAGIQQKESDVNVLIQKDNLLVRKVC